MAEMTISEAAHKAGVRTSTLRYYEEIGLLPYAQRKGGQRRYESDVLLRLAVIHTARQAGFSLTEIAVLINDVLPNPTASAQWHDLLQRKLTELNQLQTHVEQMRSLLEDVMRCHNPQLADCIYEAGQKHALRAVAQPTP